MSTLHTARHSFPGERIFDGWSACLNYFDSSLPFQLSFLNHRSRPGSRYSVNIPMQDDDYNSVRCEYVEMLENQIAKSNNGIVRTKLLTFGVNVDDLPTARARLERVEADICGNFKKLGVKCRSLSGLERLELLHGQLHPGSGSPFRFSWDMIPKTGLSTKDFIAPDSFDFRFSRLFRVGTTWGAASYLQILASELSDKLLAELLEMDAEMTITLHIQTVDQAAAVKSIKAKVSDIDKMKVEEQKKAARSGYDMDILPPDLVTYSNDAKTLLEDLQSRNERMFLLTFLVVSGADNGRHLSGAAGLCGLRKGISARGASSLLFRRLQSRREPPEKPGTHEENAGEKAGRLLRFAASKGLTFRAFLRVFPGWEYLITFLPGLPSYFVTSSTSGHVGPRHRKEVSLGDRTRICDFESCHL